MKSKFAEFGVRMAGVGLDFYIAMFAAMAVRDYVLTPIGVTVTDHRPVILAVLFVYFTAFWASPLRATPIQLLFGMRVVDESGDRLTLARAAMRSAVLVGLIAIVFLGFKAPPNPLFIVIALAGYILIYLAAVTTKRQGAHDLLARSMVINRRADVTKDEPQPSILRMVIDAVVLAIPVFVLWNIGQIMNDRDMLYRTNYALDATRGLQAGVEVVYEMDGHWPLESEDPDLFVRENFPDGGYYELEDNGVIRIQFEVREELKHGSIVLTPEWVDGRVSWTCHVEGNIRQGHLPAKCRDN